MPQKPRHRRKKGRALWRRIGEEFMFWAVAVANVAFELAIRLRRRATPWIRTLSPATRAAWREAAAAFRVFRHEELPALWRLVRPYLLVAAGFSKRASMAGARTTGRWSTTGARFTGRATRRAGRMARPYAIRAGAGVLALALAAWFLPGPLLWTTSHAVDSDLPPLDERSTVVAADGTVLGTLHKGVNRTVVSLDDVPSLARRLVILAEDQRFWNHDGYDMRGMLRAVSANLRSREVAQGGSTITQQLAKQNFTGSGRNVFRKMRELVHAVALEHDFTKEELLERYLNQVYFGAGAYGIAAAAEEYFGVAVGELSVAQAALLAGLIRSPVTIDPRGDPKEARRLRNLILEAAAGADVLDGAEAARVRAEPVVLQPPRPQDLPPIVDAVVRSFLADPVFGPNRRERASRLFTGGLRIRTTIDPRLQGAAEDAVVAAMDGGAPGAALAVVDPGTGEIRALASAGPPEVASLDLATQARRQPGSAIKPLVALAALDAGLPTWQGLAGSGPVTFDVGPEPWRVDNYDERDHGTVDLRKALVSSVNTAFAQLGVALGPDAVARVAGKAGIDVEAAMGPPDARGPSVALGGLHRGVSPLELASAYGVFATGGLHARPTMVARVLDPHGDIVYRHRPRMKRTASEAEAVTVREILQEAVEEGTGKKARLPGWPVAGKTGTTQSSADAWFVGVLPGVAAAAWVGHPTEAVPMPDRTGGSLAAPLWRYFMIRALEGAVSMPFPPMPPGADAGLGDAPLDLPEAERTD